MNIDYPILKSENFDSEKKLCDFVNKNHLSIRIENITHSDKDNTFILFYWQVD